MIGFQEGINLIFSKIKEGDNIVFSPLRFENDLFINWKQEQNLYIKYMLFDKLGIKKAHYIGHSMGGNVGYKLLKNNSDKLLSFTTFGTTAKLNKSEITIGFMKIIYKLLSTKIIAQLSSFAGRNKDSKKKIQEMIRQTRKETNLKIIPHLARFDYLNVIKSANIPSMIIKGDMDKEINKVIGGTIGGTIEAWQEKDNFSLIEMKNTGHFANFDNPEKFNKIIKHIV